MLVNTVMVSSDAIYGTNDRNVSAKKKTRYRYFLRTFSLSTSILLASHSSQQPHQRKTVNKGVSPARCHSDNLHRSWPEFLNRQRKDKKQLLEKRSRNSHFKKLLSESNRRNKQSDSAGLTRKTTPFFDLLSHSSQNQTIRTPWGRCCKGAVLPRVASHALGNVT